MGSSSGHAKCPVGHCGPEAPPVLLCQAAGGCPWMTHSPSLRQTGTTSFGNQPLGSQPPLNEPSNLWAPQCSHLRYGPMIRWRPRGPWGQMRSCLGACLPTQKRMNRYSLDYLLNQEVKMGVVQKFKVSGKKLFALPPGRPDPAAPPQSSHPLRIPWDSFLAWCMHLPAYACESLKKPKYSSLYTLLWTSLAPFKTRMKYMGHT